MAKLIRRSWIPLVAMALLCGGLVSQPQEAIAEAATNGEIGHVAAVTGRAYRILPSGERRMLVCGESLKPGDALVTGEWGSVAVSIGDVYAQVSDMTGIRVGMAPGDVPEFQVIGGGLRVLDTRDDRETPVRIVTEFAVVSGAADDTEVFVREHKNISLCAGTGALSANVRGAGVQSVAAGQCSFMKKGDKNLADAERPEELIGLDAEVSCERDLIIGAASMRLLPTDVAAPPPPIVMPAALAPIVNPNPCSNPSSCYGVKAQSAPTPPPPPSRSIRAIDRPESPETNPFAS